MIACFLITLFAWCIGGEIYLYVTKGSQEFLIAV